MMTAREKLIEILSTKIHPREGVDPAVVVADFLLDNDVVPVVRCIDCRCYEHGVCKYHAAAFLPEWFCWNGERREHNV